jgi:ABC-type glycerol-3-phosphate transport system substrate-binding protein
MWSHFVPAHDTWFDPWAREWGSRVGVEVTVDHINYAELPARTQAEIQAGQGHDLILHIAPVPQYEPSVLDLTDVVTESDNRHGTQLDLCRKSSYNPTTRKFFAFTPSWVPDPGDYRTSLWTPVGLPNGPSTWDDLLRGGAEIKNSQGIQVGIGMSQEIDSNMAGRALLWSYGASIQDEAEQVVLNSPETVEAVDYMSRLYRDAMTPEVFSWNAASNNQGLAAGQLSFILNSISAWRTSQETDPETANDIPAAARAGGREGGQPRHVQLDRSELRREPGRGERVPAALHRQPRRHRMAVPALRLPGLPGRRARPRCVVEGRPVRRAARGQAHAACGRGRLEHERRLPRPVQHRGGRGVRDVRHPEHVREGRPR